MNLLFNLQLFAEAGASAGAAEGGQAASAGDASAPLTGDAGAASAPQSGTEARRPYSEIRELYANEIDGEMKKTVEKRLKKAGKDSANLKKAERLISRAFKQYGVAEGDYDGLEKAVAADDSYYSELAARNGTSPEVERRLDESERVRKEAEDKLREREEKDGIREQYREIERKVLEAKELYPDFDLATEMENPTFAQWASIPGVSFVQAYRTAHFDELSSAAAAASASAAVQKTVNSVISGSKRPQENGVGNSSPADVSTDPSKLSLKEIDDMINRARHGDKFRF